MTPRALAAIGLMTFRILALLFSSLFLALMYRAWTEGYVGTVVFMGLALVTSVGLIAMVLGGVE